tara:strand:+ start:167 stop:1075 length:909 start_codon:yes stop_codon:yes gene_type:complete
MSYAAADKTNPGVIGLETNVREWYQNYLGRAPDEKEFVYYMDQLTGGRNIYETAAEIQYSPEAQELATKKYQATQDRIAAADKAAKDYETQRDDILGKYEDLGDSYGALGGKYKELGGQYRELEGQVGGIKSERDAAKLAASAAESRFRNLQRRYDNYKMEMEENVDKFKQQYESELALRKADAELFKQKEADFLDQLNYQARAEADAQLRGLRAGSTVTADAGSRGPRSLVSGQTSASRQEKGAVVGIRSQVDATDSVLNRSGPVVQLINKIQARRPSGGSSGAPTSFAGSTGNYYSSRFG